MPSPLAHTMAGIAAAWAADLVPGRRRWRAAPVDASLFNLAGGRLTVICAALAVLPDIDLALGIHRMETHSIAAVALFTILAGAVTEWVTRLRAASAKSGVPSPLRVAAMCGAAYATHLLLDWLGSDVRAPRGLQALWPFSQAWYISDWDLFPRIERRAVLSLPTLRTNLLAMATEAAILLPILLLLFLVRVKALAGLAPEASVRDHAPQ